MSADQTALVRIGAQVRARLAADPAVHRVPVDTAEIFAIGGFLAAEECGHLIDMIDRVAQPSRVFDPESEDRYRTSYSGDVDPHDSFVRMIDRRICDLLGLDAACSESMQGQRYQAGQEYRAHFDWLDTKASYWTGDTKRAGQRSWTAMAYLSDVAEGGETAFERIGVSVAPQAGALLVWNNAAPDGRQNPHVLHAAKPVVSGVKYVVTKWFRVRAWR